MNKSINIEKLVENPSHKTTSEDTKNILNQESPSKKSYLRFEEGDI
jgi:hypothetical protein